MKDLQEMKRVKLFLAGLCMVVMPCVSGAQEEEAVKGLHLVGRDLGKNVLLRWAAGDYALWMAALQKGFVLEGLDKLGQDALAFHAGTKTGAQGEVLSAGGRVIAVTCLAPALGEALAKAYAEVGKIGFEKMYYRKDIGKDVCR